jgi:hypothetical protein
MERTAVEWFAERISHGGLVSKKQFNELLEEAKEMEKHLYICNKCKSQINEKEIMQQVQDSKESD